VNSPSETSTTLELVAALRAELDRVRFDFPAPASAQAEARRAALAANLDQAALPALRQMAAPAVITLVGGTGVGKSALANALAGGRPLSPAGPLRPTTRQPLLLASPATAAMLGGHPAGAAARLIEHPWVPPSWAILDCADPFVVGNDPQRAQPDVPAAALLVVTSALRYGDALLWDLLQGVGRSGTPVALVVNRLPGGAWEVVKPELARRLEALALGYIPLFPVAELPGAPEALPASGIGPVVDWLRQRVPPPIDPPDPLPHLQAVAAAAAELARDQLVQGRALELLGSATEAQAATIAAAGPQLPLQIEPQLAEVWSVLAGPGGPLADATAQGVAPGSPDQPERRERWGAALAQLGAAVADAVARDASAAAGIAAGAMAAVWRGPGVPAGSSQLLDRAGLASQAPGAPPGPGAYQAWSDRLGRALADLDTPQARAAAQALAPAGLLALVQAAALGAAGPAQLVGELLGAQAEAALGAARAAFRQTRAEVAQAALAPFRGAVAAGQTASGALGQLAGRLSRAVERGGP
jgi:hypothetical protein